MGSIYEAATLTISVTSSAAVTEGFLGLRRETAVADGGGKVVKWTGFDGSEAHTLVRRRLPHSGIVSETSDPAGCPLLRRGWTLQERLLATRTLHFLPDEMLWECRSDFVCECSSVEADQRWKNGHLRGSLFNVSVSNPEGADWVALWQQLVKDYSKRQLTDEVDRLPALSGIAARFKTSNTRLGRYFAGLWESGILWQMTWQADWSIFVAASSMHATTDTMNHSTGTRHPQSTRSTAQPNSSMASAFSNPVGNYRKSLKPSWSWISTRNPVEWDMVGPELRSSSRIDAKLLYASCLADPMNPFGQVTAGEMLLEAHAFSTKILANDLGFIWKLENGAIMIPDVPNLQLVPGDTIHCALIYDRVKDGMLLWVGLALQRLSNNNSTGEGTERFYRVGLVKGTMHSSYLGTGLFRRQILIE
ncbi:hypothetical protein TruAng_005874 [Truncatella angustata]|nr:hypothetical protein TruAng_005874 [Truncatella angustata]